MFAAVNGNVINIYSTTTFEDVLNLKGHNEKVCFLKFKRNSSPKIVVPNICVFLSYVEYDILKEIHSSSFAFLKLGSLNNVTVHIIVP